MNDILRSIADIRAHLAWARNFVHYDPRDCQYHLATACHKLGRLDSGKFSLIPRLMGNLGAASIHVLTYPDLAVGYIDGVSCELAQLYRQIERQLQEAP